MSAVSFVFARTIFGSLGIFLLLTASAARLRADPIHIINLKTVQTTEEGKKIFRTECKFALGDAPPSGQAWPENKVLGVSLPSKSDGAMKEKPRLPEYVANKNASLVAVNFLPIDKRRGVCFLLSWPADRAVQIVPHLENEIAKICRSKQKAFDAMDFQVERIEGDLLTITTQTATTQRYTLTVRVVPDAPQTNGQPNPKTASTPYTLQLVSHSQTKAPSQPNVTFPKFP